MILLDHCTPRRYLRLLKSWGYDAEVITAYIEQDASDLQVVELAQKLDAVLLTIDMDFSNILDYPPQNYAGIVVMRYQAADEIQIDTLLQQALKDLYRDGLRGALVIISPGRYRVRRQKQNF